jgi:hypothetical protein
MKGFQKEIAEFLGLYVICIITTYLLPNFVSQVFFLMLLLLFYKSKENYFWFAFFLFLVDPPGGFFPIDDYNYGLAMYNILPGTGRLIYFQELFIFTALFKAMKLGIRPRFLFKKPLALLGVYLLLLFLASFLFGMTPFRMFNTIRNIIPWSLLFSILVLMPHHEDWQKFFRIIFILLGISVATQIFSILLTRPPAVFLGIDFQPVMDYGPREYSDLAGDPSLLRPISSPHVSLLALMGAMFYILFKGRTFSKTWLFIIIFLALFSIVVTATRGWIIAYFLMLFLFGILGGRNMKRFIQFFLVMGAVSFLFLLSPLISKHIRNSFIRVETVEEITKGDLTAGGTDTRLYSYSPKVLAKFYESPIIGWGFSNEFADNTNGHVGNQALLLNVGIIGFLLFIYFWYSICRIPIKTSYYLPPENPFKSSLFVIPIIFLGYFIIHSSSGQLFQYTIGFQYGVSQIFFYAFANFYIITAKDFSLINKTDQSPSGSLK